MSLKILLLTALLLLTAAGLVINWLVRRSKWYAINSRRISSRQLRRYSTTPFTNTKPRQW
jgi:hypothetical protein